MNKFGAACILMGVLVGTAAALNTAAKTQCNGSGTEQYSVTICDNALTYRRRIFSSAGCFMTDALYDLTITADLTFPSGEPADGATAVDVDLSNVVATATPLSRDGEETLDTQCDPTGPITVGHTFDLTACQNTTWWPLAAGGCDTLYTQLAVESTGAGLKPIFSDCDVARATHCTANDRCTAAGDGSGMTAVADAALYCPMTETADFHTLTALRGTFQSQPCTAVTSNLYTREDVSVCVDDAFPDQAYLKMTVAAYTSSTCHPDTFQFSAGRDQTAILDHRGFSGAYHLRVSSEERDTRIATFRSFPVMKDLLQSNCPAFWHSVETSMANKINTFEKVTLRVPEECVEPNSNSNNNNGGTGSGGGTGSSECDRCDDVELITLEMRSAGQLWVYKEQTQTVVGQDMCARCLRWPSTQDSSELVATRTSTSAQCPPTTTSVETLGGLYADLTCRQDGEWHRGETIRICQDADDATRANVTVQSYRTDGGCGGQGQGLVAEAQMQMVIEDGTSFPYPMRYRVVRRSLQITHWSFIQQLNQSCPLTTGLSQALAAGSQDFRALYISDQMADSACALNKLGNDVSQCSAGPWTHSVLGHDANTLFLPDCEGSNYCSSDSRCQRVKGSPDAVKLKNFKDGCLSRQPLQGTYVMDCSTNGDNSTSRLNMLKFCPVNETYVSVLQTETVFDSPKCTGHSLLQADTSGAAQLTAPAPGADHRNFVYHRHQLSVTFLDGGFASTHGGGVCGGVTLPTQTRQQVQISPAPAQCQIGSSQVYLGDDTGSGGMHGSYALDAQNSLWLATCQTGTVTADGSQSCGMLTPVSRLTQASPEACYHVTAANLVGSYRSPCHKKDTNLYRRTFRKVCESSDATHDLEVIELDSYYDSCDNGRPKFQMEARMFVNVSTSTDPNVWRSDAALETTQQVMTVYDDSVLSDMQAQCGGLAWVKDKPVDVSAGCGAHIEPVSNCPRRGSAFGFGRGLFTHRRVFSSGVCEETCGSANTCLTTRAVPDDEKVMVETGPQGCSPQADGNDFFGTWRTPCENKGGTSSYTVMEFCPQQSDVLVVSGVRTTWDFAGDGCVLGTETAQTRFRMTSTISDSGDIKYRHFQTHIEDVSVVAYSASGSSEFSSSCPGRTFPLNQRVSVNDGCLGYGPTTPCASGDMYFTASIESGFKPFLVMGTCNWAQGTEMCAPDFQCTDLDYSTPYYKTGPASSQVCPDGRVQVSGSAAGSLTLQAQSVDDPDQIDTAEVESLLIAALVRAIPGLTPTQILVNTIEVVTSDQVQEDTDGTASNNALVSLSRRAQAVPVLATDGTLMRLDHPSHHTMRFRSQFSTQSVSDADELTYLLVDYVVIPDTDGADPAAAVSQVTAQQSDSGSALNEELGSDYHTTAITVTPSGGGGGTGYNDGVGQLLRQGSTTLYSTFLACVVMAVTFRHMW